MNDINKQQIYQKYHNKVYNYLLYKTNNLFDAEDLASDVFVKVYENYESYDENKASLSTWIYTITRNTLIDYYRTHREFSEIPEDAQSLSNIENEINRAEILDKLADALNQLDRRERIIVIQHYYYDKTLKSISEEMNISYSYIKLLNNKAIDNLKATLSL